MWIFDLDNTLHDARASIFPSMHGQINAFLQRRFNLDEAGAGKMREHFWRTYGTTLEGLMRRHGVHPRQFLAETHVFPELADLVVHENARGARVGEALVAEAERWAAGRGCVVMRVRSNVVRERAHRFYERLGYAVFKTQRVFGKDLD